MARACGQAAASRAPSARSAAGWNPYMPASASRSSSVTHATGSPTSVRAAAPGSNSNGACASHCATSATTSARPAAARQARASGSNTAQRAQRRPAAVRSSGPKPRSSGEAAGGSARPAARLSSTSNSRALPT